MPNIPSVNIPIKNPIQNTVQYPHPPNGLSQNLSFTKFPYRSSIIPFCIPTSKEYIMHPATKAKAILTVTINITNTAIIVFNS